MKPFLTVKEVSEILQVPRVTVGVWIRRGLIPSVPWGKQRRVPRAALEAWLQALNEQALQTWQKEGQDDGKTE